MLDYKNNYLFEVTNVGPYLARGNALSPQRLKETLFSHIVQNGNIRTYVHSLLCSWISVSKYPHLFRKAVTGLEYALQIEAQAHEGWLPKDVLDILDGEKKGNKNSMWQGNFYDTTSGLNLQPSTAEEVSKTLSGASADSLKATSFATYIHPDEIEKVDSYIKDSQNKPTYAESVLAYMGSIVGNYAEVDASNVITAMFIFLKLSFNRSTHTISAATTHITNNKAANSADYLSLYSPLVGCATMMILNWVHEEVIKDSPFRPLRQYVELLAGEHDMIVSHPSVPALAKAEVILGNYGPLTNVTKLEPSKRSLVLKQLEQTIFTFEDELSKDKQLLTLEDYVFNTSYIPLAGPSKGGKTYTSMLLAERLMEENDHLNSVSVVSYNESNPGHKIYQTDKWAVDQARTLDDVIRSSGDIIIVDSLTKVKGDNPQTIQRGFAREHLEAALKMAESLARLTNALLIFTFNIPKDEDNILFDHVVDTIDGFSVLSFYVSEEVCSFHVRSENLGRVDDQTDRSSLTNRFFSSQLDHFKNKEEKHASQLLNNSAINGQSVEFTETLSKVDDTILKSLINL